MNTALVVGLVLGLIMGIMKHRAGDGDVGWWSAFECNCNCKCNCK